MKFKIDNYAVFGNPIEHSKSPLIHNLFAKQTEEKLIYKAKLVAHNNFKNTVIDFYNAGGKGLNITVPFKQEAWQLVNQLQPRAKLAGAVNTIWFNKQGDIIGDNTDGIGLVRDLINNHQQTIYHKKVLILGAGGAVRGVLTPILAEKPINLTIANRTVSKAEELVNLFSKANNLSYSSYAELELQKFDIIINGTSSSLQGQLPPLPNNILADNAIVYDMMYANQPTIFMKWGKNQGAKFAIDGLGMLIEQAAEAFFIWRGVRPNTKVVIQYFMQYY
jgi:shikimate dehydrogenase